jgi:uncharacterized protein YraI
MNGFLSNRSRVALALAVCGVLAAGCADGGAAAGDAGESSGESSTEALTGAHAVGTPYVTLADVNLRKAPGTDQEVLAVVPRGTRVLSASAAPQNGWYGVTTSGNTGWIRGDFLKLATDGGGSAGNVSARGQDQMRRIIAYADAHNSGSSAGRCFEFVWRYLAESGYGLIDDFNDASDMPSAFARNFAEYMNANGNAARWGLQRLPLDNPYDAPAGAVVVVAAGSPGTAHPTAGDIAIAAGGGRFINDGPRMGYGGSRQAFVNGGGRVLGIYVPR